MDNPERFSLPYQFRFPIMHCRVLNGITLRSDGRITCDDSLGYHLQLGEAIAGRDWKIRELTRGPIYAHIRQAFAGGTLPWRGTCENCDVLSPELPVNDTLDQSITLRIEPTLQCRLNCFSCKRKQAIRRRNDDWNLRPEVLESLIRACVADALSIEKVVFLGWGDPLEHPHFAALVEIIRHSYPQARIELTTHGNVDYRATLAGTRIDELVVSVDGARQATYEKYRRGGDFKSAVRFMKAAIANGQDLTWKYIVFDHNDATEELHEAQLIAREIGVSRLLFVLTNSKGKSRQQSLSGIDTFPLIWSRATVSPAAALQRSATPYVPEARFIESTEADAPLFHLDRCHVTVDGLLSLEGWACERSGDPLAKVELEIEDEPRGELDLNLPRTDVNEIFGYPDTLLPGFIKWTTSRADSRSVTLAFSLHSASGIHKLPYVLHSIDRSPQLGIDDPLAEAGVPVRQAENRATVEIVAVKHIQAV